jgi:transcriptional regulator with XRE-family HTH domain
MSSLGQELKRERELRAISLKDIANLTKIGLRYLQALEEDRLDMLPGSFFIKGVLRAYSKSIGADEDYFLNKYHEEILFKTEAQDKERKKAAQAEKPAQKKRSWIWVAPAIILFTVVAVLFYVFYLRPRHTGPPIIKTPASAVPQIQKTPPLPVDLEAAVKTKVDKLKLDLVFTAETWIQVYADGELQMDGIKRAGDKADCTALKEILIHCGNAGGFDYSINGQPAKPMGAPGGIVHDVKITLDNYREFLLAGEREKTPSSASGVRS